MSQSCQKMLRLVADPRGWKIGKTKVYTKFTPKVFTRDVMAAILLQPRFQGPLSFFLEVGGERTMGPRLILLPRNNDITAKLVR